MFKRYENVELKKKIGRERHIRQSTAEEFTTPLLIQRPSDFNIVDSLFWNCHFLINNTKLGINQSTQFILLSIFSQINNLRKRNLLKIVSLKSFKIVLLHFLPNLIFRGVMRLRRFLIADLAIQQII